MKDGISDLEIVSHMRSLSVYLILSCKLISRFWTKTWTQMQQLLLVWSRTLKTCSSWLCYASFCCRSCLWTVLESLFCRSSNRFHDNTNCSHDNTNWSQTVPTTTQTIFEKHV